MKKISYLILIFFLLFIGFSSCEKKEDAKGDAPELPPLESMSFDFNSITNVNKSGSIASDSKSTIETGTKINLAYSALNVGFWNLILAGTLIVPVTSFAKALETEPVFIGNATWQWSYSVAIGLNIFSARLTGKVDNSNVKWEMYISKTGNEPFNDFLWFEGTSALDGLSGQWILNHSPQFPENLLQIDWVRDGDGIGEIKYTNIRDLENNRQTNLNKGAFIQAGYQDNDLNVYYNIHIYDGTLSNFTDINIEWNNTLYNGHVKSPSAYSDENWHCWDNLGFDIACN